MRLQTLGSTGTVRKAQTRSLPAAVKTIEAEQSASIASVGHRDALFGCVRTAPHVWYVGMATKMSERMLQAAYDIVAKEGLEGLHARSVAAKVGVNHAAVHYYFPRRTDLLVGLANRAFEDFSKGLAKRCAQHSDSLDKLAAHFAYVADMCGPKSGYSIVWASLFVAARTDIAVRAEVVRNLREWAAIVQIDINVARQSDPAIAGPMTDAETLVSAFVGLMLSSQLLNGAFSVSDRLDALRRDLA